MASNPMQKKAMNAFLLGIVIMLLISAIIGALAYMFFVAPLTKKDETTGEIVARDVYVITQPVKSGEAISVGFNAQKQKVQTSITPDQIIDPGDAKARIDLPVGTIITPSMLLTDETPSNDTRLVELNMITLPTNVNVGTCIDIRLSAPTGQDYIVISKKNIVTMTGDTIGIYLTDQEIITMNSVIVDAYIMKASNLYAVQYVDAGMQTAAIPTYQVSVQAANLIKADPNIEQKARDSFAWNENLRGYINSDLSTYSQDGQTNLETGIQKQIQDAKAARQQYLTGVAPAQ